jgi:hypothetical protein
MDRVWTCAVLSMLLGCGCGGGTAETETETTVETETETETEVTQTETTPPPAPACDRAALDSLGATLSGGLQVGAPVRSDVAVPVGAAGQVASETGPILVVGDSEVSFNGTAVAGNDGARARAIGTAFGQLQPAPAFVYVATTGPIARVVALTARLPQPITVRLLVRPPPPAADHPAVASLRAQTDPAARCTAGFAAMDQALGSCNDAREAGHRLVGGSPACPAATLASGDSPAFVDQLRACGCSGADLGAVSALIAYEQSEGGANLRYVDLPRTRPTGAAARQTATDFVTAPPAPAGG